MEAALDLESSVFGLGGSTLLAPTKRCAGLAEWEDALHSRRSVLGRGGSMPPAGTNLIEYGELAEWSKAPHC
jgi:hypothetical protein